MGMYSHMAMHEMTFVALLNITQFYVRTTYMYILNMYSNIHIILYPCLGGSIAIVSSLAMGGLQPCGSVQLAKGGFRPCGSVQLGGGRAPALR